MSRDNVLRATVTVYVRHAMSNNDPTRAVEQWVDELREEFGRSASIRDLTISFLDDRGNSQLLVPDTASRDQLLRAISGPVSLTTTDGECNGVYPVYGGGWSVRWAGNVLTNTFNSEPEARAYLTELCGEHVWVKRKCARCGAIQN